MSEQKIPSFIVHNGCIYFYNGEIPKDAEILNIPNLDTSMSYFSEQYVKELLDEKDKEIITLKEQIPQWISVKDKLPNNFTSVLMCGKSIRSTGIYMDSQFFSDFKLPVHKDVTHWMEIPKQP